LLHGIIQNGFFHLSWFQIDPVFILGLLVKNFLHNSAYA
jgi:hypothetical protein